MCRGEANCVYSLGNIALARSDHDAARKAYGGTRALSYRQVGDCARRGQLALRASAEIALARLRPRRRPQGLEGRRARSTCQDRMVWIGEAKLASWGFASRSRWARFRPRTPPRQGPMRTSAPRSTRQESTEVLGEAKLHPECSANIARAPLRSRPPPARCTYEDAAARDCYRQIDWSYTARPTSIMGLRRDRAVPATTTTPPRKGL